MTCPVASITIERPAPSSCNDSRRSARPRSVPRFPFNRSVVSCATVSELDGVFGGADIPDASLAFDLLKIGDVASSEGTNKTRRVQQPRPQCRAFGSELPAPCRVRSAPSGAPHQYGWLNAHRQVLPCNGLDFLPHLWTTTRRALTADFTSRRTRANVVVEAGPCAATGAFTGGAACTTSRIRSAGASSARAQGRGTWPTRSGA